MDLAAAVNHLVFVYSLASASDTFAEETQELQETISSSARQEQVLTPSTDIDIFNIVKQRLFESISQNGAETVANAYLNAYRTSKVNLPDACKEAPYRNAIAQSYPFHPELFQLLTKKIASISEFQKTRGALRLFAQVVRHLWIKEKEKGTIAIIHSHHIPIGIDDDVTNDLTSRLQGSPMRHPIGADIYNPNGREAYAQVQDQEWLAAGKPPLTSWVARTIFLHSLTQGITSGIRRTELNLSLLTPDLEIGFVARALERLSAVAWYLDDDPVTSLARFKEEPSINKIVTEEKEQVGRTEAKNDLRKKRDSIFAKKFFTLISSPSSSSDVDDRSEDLALCLIDFDEATVNQSTDSTPPLVEQIFNNTGESGKFRVFRNRLLFLVANQGELERAIDLAREYKAIQNILKSQTRLEDLSETQQKQLKEREGAKDLEVRIALTNAYRHLFYPDQDFIKAPTGLKHYVLPAQDSSTVKGKNNQQDLILKALKDCQKIRSEEEQKPYAPAFIISKVWSAGLDHLTTKSLKEAFSKDLSLKFLLDAEVSLLKDTIRKGLQEGQWDLKGGDRLYIKTEGNSLTLPDHIEFSDRLELYRRGILKSPAPKEIELSVQNISNGVVPRTVRVRWRANGALTIQLYQDNNLIQGEFRPSDEYETQIEQSTKFQIVADYGNGETACKETQVAVSSNGNGNDDTPPIIIPAIAPPAVLELEGSINSVCTQLNDQCNDYKVKTIERLELIVSSGLDYRKLGTIIPLLSKYPLTIDLTATLTTEGQFVRLEYQGSSKGFQNFHNSINGLLNDPKTQSNIVLKVIIKFDQAIAPTSSELTHIQTSLQRNPVDRLNLIAKVDYNDARISA